MTAKVRAEPDPALEARILSRRPLSYSEGASASLDRPAVVRAASGIAHCGAFVAIVSDDAHFITTVDARSGAVSAVTLPTDESGVRQFDDARGNKSRKLDLESCVLSTISRKRCLLAFGSGSTPLRERAVLWALDGSEPPRIRHLPALYAALRNETAFSGSELNIEGAIVVDGVIRFFQRGNGASRGSLVPIDATVDVPIADVLALVEGAPGSIAVHDVVQYDLGATGGVRLTFTDATSGPGRQVLYTAAAEESPDVTRDGPIAGAAVGVIGTTKARYAALVDVDGTPSKDKVEGVTLDPDDASTALVVIDADDPGRASELCVVRLSGPWWS